MRGILNESMELNVQLKELDIMLSGTISRCTVFGQQLQRVDWDYEYKAETPANHNKQVNSV